MDKGIVAKIYSHVVKPSLSSCVTAPFLVNGMKWYDTKFIITIGKKPGVNKDI